MSEVTITNIKDGLKLFEDKLQEASDAIAEQSDRIGVERLTTTDGYVLHHQRGIFGLMYSGDNYSKREDNNGPSLFMKRDLSNWRCCNYQVYRSAAGPFERFTGNQDAAG